MGTEQPLRFRPTVVVCVGEQGRAVGEQLLLLLPGIDAARRAGIALVEVDEDSAQRDGAFSGSWYAPRPDDESEPALADVASKPLSLLMVEALRGEEASRRREQAQPRLGVLDDLVVRRIREAGYVVPRAMVVVWVAAAAHSPALVHVAAAVREALRSEHVEGWVLLALTNVYPRDVDLHEEHAARCRGQQWTPLLVGGADLGDGTPTSSMYPAPSLPLSQRTEQPKALATYAYLFESHGEHGTFWEGPDDVPFAAAEAIFVLTASGITTTREFEETLRQSLPQHVHHHYERLSGVGTSRLTFPRYYVEEFAANQLGASVLREWARSRKISLPFVAQAEHKRAAQRTLAAVRDRTQDDVTLDRGGRSSPRLSADTIARVRGLNRPAPDGGLIFAHFRPSELKRLDDGRLTLAERLEVQRAKAEEGFPVWKSTIRQGWERYGQELERKVTAYADEQILDGPEGVTRARTFAEELNRQLTQERDALARRRETREVAYERYLRETAELAHGPWERVATQSEVQPVPAAVPISGETWQGVASRPFEPLPAPATVPLSPVLASMPLTLGEFTATGAEYVSTAAAPGPSSREQALAHGLAQRHAWLHERVPRWPALLGLGAIMVPPWVLLLQQLLPASWMAHTYAALILTLAMIVLAAICCVGWYDLRRRREQAAAADLRRLYRRMFARRCERHEDERREALLVGLQARVRRMLDRLADWDSFATGLAVRMEEQANQIERGLFEGAMGRRDVLVANRQLLHPTDYDLHDLDDDLATKRRAQPLEGYEWHASPSAMLAPLRDTLRGQVSLMGSAPESIVAPVREFCRGVVRPYVAGDFADLGAALEAMPANQTAGLFDHVMDRSIILCHPIDRPRVPLAFVAARDEHHEHIQQRSLAANMIPQTLHDREWMGVLRLLPGGSRPSFHDVETDRQQFMQQREDEDPVLSRTRPRRRTDSRWAPASGGLRDLPTQRIAPAAATQWTSSSAPLDSGPLGPWPPTVPPVLADGDASGADPLAPRALDMVPGALADRAERGIHPTGGPASAQFQLAQRSRRIAARGG